MADAPKESLINENDAPRFSTRDWEKTPEPIKLHLIWLHEMVLKYEETMTLLRARIESLEAKRNENSTNSNRPPSSDNPFNKPAGKSKEESKPVRKKKRKGFRQALLDPGETRNVYPRPCQCGCGEYDNLEPYYTHQHMEFPRIVMQIIHFILYKGRCRSCGRVSKGYIPREFQTGYGPRLSALIAELSGIAGNSREMVQSFCSSVLGIPISLGAIQKVIDRGSEAVKPHYEAIGDRARTEEVNHVDETPWYNGGKLNWLWVMASPVAAFFMVHTNRSREAFEQLVGAWAGILVSDDYRVYRKWVNLRQNCLSHLIRTAKGLSERADPEVAACGKWVRKELQRLIRMAKAPPTQGEWRAFFARFCRLIALYRDSESEAGTLVRRLEEEMDTLFVFLVKEGVDPTNNFGERIIRYGVLWRKRSQGTKGDKGNRWVERILSLRQTCRLHGKSSFEVLVDALHAHFNGQEPDLAWIRGGE